MTLINTRELLQAAQAGRYAVPAFNIHNLETIQVVVRTAAELYSPVILAATPGTVAYAGAEFLLAMAVVAARKYPVPISLHLDHFQDPDMLIEMIDMGFPSVMIDASHHPLAENMAIVRSVVEYAHQRDVSVEAELGRLGGKEEDVDVDDSSAFLTDPAEAEEFVNSTGVDSLAVAIGTAHGLYKAPPRLDYKRLAEISLRLSVPLVLHGGSGVPDKSVQETIKRGICKVNIATELKVAFAAGVKEHFSVKPEADDPRQYMEPGKALMKHVVRDKILMCGSHGKGGAGK